MSARQEVEDIYPLTVAQQAWLLHCLRGGDNDPGFQQNRAVLHGDLDIDAFGRAWQAVVDRHTALRTSFHWRDLDRAAQVVHRRAKLPFQTEDWRSLSSSDQAARLDDFLTIDRRRGLSLEAAPLMRLALLRVSDHRHELVWSLHHLLMDGWATAAVWREALHFYDAYREGIEPSLPPARPFRDFVRWLQQQPHSAAEEYWREVFRGMQSPTPLGARQRTGAAMVELVVHTVELPTKVGASLEEAARQQRLTPSSVVLGAWALVLSRWSGLEDVLFGTTVSGRPPEIPGVDSIVGLMLNTLPTRVGVLRDMMLTEWLRQSQADRADALPYQHTPTEQVMRWSGFSSGARLFESIVVFENYPSGLSVDESPGGLSIDGYRGTITSAYPLNLIVLPGERYRMLLYHDASRFAPAEIAWLDQVWRLVLDRLANMSGCTVGEVLEALPEPPASRQTEASASLTLLKPSPETSMEQRIAAIWSEELDVDTIGALSNFFDLGGYSLLATRVLDRTRQEIGVELELEDLVFQTLRQVAAKCERPPT